MSTIRDFDKKTDALIAKHQQLGELAYVSLVASLGSAIVNALGEEEAAVHLDKALEISDRVLTRHHKQAS